MRRVVPAIFLVFLFQLSLLGPAFGLTLPESFLPISNNKSINSEVLSVEEDVSKRSEFSTVWLTKVRENGKVRQGRYTQLTPGLYYNAGTVEHPEYKVPDTTIQITEEGGVVENIGNPIHFVKSLDSNKATIEQISDGAPILAATPALILYRDTVTDRTVILAQGKGSSLSVENNVATYPDAFSGLRADLRYTVDPARVEQDVLLFEKPEAPSAYGLNDATTRFVVLTRLFHLEGDNAPTLYSPSGEKQASATGAVQGWAKVSTAESLSEEPTKEALSFLRDGKMVQRFVRSYALDGKAKHPVEKRIVTFQGMKFLAEEIPAKLILEQDLPVATLQVAHCASSSRTGQAGNDDDSSCSPSAKDPTPFKSLDITALLKNPPEEKGKLAQLPQSKTAHSSAAKPFVLDYISVTGTINTDFTFELGQTYFISGDVLMTGTVTFEPNTIIKYQETDSQIPATESSLEITTAPVFKTVSPMWAYFTSMNHDDLGETISGSTGTPAIKIKNHLTLHSGDIRLAQFLYAENSIDFIGDGGTLTIEDSTILAGETGVSATGNSGGTSTLGLNNVVVGLAKDAVVLDDSSGNPLTVNAFNLTFHDLSESAFVYTFNDTNSVATIKDSLFAGIALNTFTGSGVGTFTDDYNAFYSTLTEGSGANNLSTLSSDPILADYYLDQNSGLVDAGSQTATSAGLYHHRTNQNGDIEADTQVDIGFHQLPNFIENAVLATSSLNITDNAMIDGQVRVNDNATGVLSVGENVAINTGDTLVADTINLSSTATIDGDMHYNTLNHNGATRNGQEFTPVPLPVFEDMPLLLPSYSGPNAADVIVSAGQTQTISPNYTDGYLELKAETNATLILEAGYYFVKNIVLEDGAQLLFNGPVDVRVAEDINAGDDTVIGPNAGTTLNTYDFIFYVSNELDIPTPVRFGEGAYVIGIFYSPTGTLLVRPDAIAQGVLIGKDVVLGNNSQTIQSETGSQPVAQAPVFDPDIQGDDVIAVNSAVVELSTSTPGADIFYTVDQSDPADTAGGSTFQYTGKFGFSTTGQHEVRAKTVRSGFVTSPVVINTYDVQSELAPVAASPLPGTGTYSGAFLGSVSVTLIPDPTDATIYYTTDGTEPTTGSSQYSVPIALTETTLIRTKSVKAGFIDSPTTGFFFEVKPNFGGSLPDAPEIDDNLVYEFLDSVKFIYEQTPNPIQTSLTNTIDAARAAVIRGKVLDDQLNALSGVTVSLLNQSGYGQTLTRSDGYFDLVVNGGGSYVVQYEYTGKLTAQRTVSVPIQDYTIVDDVALIPPDTQLAPVDITQGTGFYSFQGSIVESGTPQERQTTLLIPAGSTPKMVIGEDVSDVPNLDNFKVTITDVALSNLGPAGLVAQTPDNLAFNHMVKISVEAAENATNGPADMVIFDESNSDYFIVYVSDPSYLPGETKPWVSVYNPNSGAWSRSPRPLHAHTFRKVGETDGKADLECCDSNPPDYFNRFGISEAERIKIAEAFPENNISFIRMRFKAIGVNYLGFPYGIKKEVTP